MRCKLFFVGFVLAVLLAPPLVATAETIVTGDFDQGEVKGRLYRNYIGTAAYVDSRVTDVVDNYSGMAGNGWANAWQTPYSTSSIRFEVAVRGDGDAGYAELVEDNYLSFRMETSSTTAGGRHGGIGRNYAGEDGIDPTKDHTIQFTIRIEEDIMAAGALWDTDNRYTIADRAVLDGSTSASATSNNSNWIIDLQGGVNSNQWYVRHSGGSAVTGITPEQGVAYTFTIDFHSSAGTFDVTIEGTNDDFYNGEGLGLYGQATYTGLRGDLMFGTMAKRRSTSYPNPVRQFSLDGIRITQIPEPTALAMVLGLALTVLGVRRRK